MRPPVVQQIFVNVGQSELSSVCFSGDSMFVYVNVSNKSEMFPPEAASSSSPALHLHRLPLIGPET